MHNWPQVRDLQKCVLYYSIQPFYFARSFGRLANILIGSCDWWEYVQHSKLPPYQSLSAFAWFRHCCEVQAPYDDVIVSWPKRVQLSCSARLSRVDCTQSRAYHTTQAVALSTYCVQVVHKLYAIRNKQGMKATHLRDWAVNFKREEDSWCFTCDCFRFKSSHGLNTDFASPSSSSLLLCLLDKWNCILFYLMLYFFTLSYIPLKHLTPWTFLCFIISLSCPCSA